MHESQRRRACRIALILAILAGCLSDLSLYGQTAASQRGVQVANSQATTAVQPGSYYALLIGNNNYRYLNKLQTPINDANEMAQLLHDNFGFQTKVLLDADRDQILKALVEYRRTLPENSNLLIYYAGHGHHDPDTKKAYWLPVDAEKDDNTRWIIADDITSDVRAMPSSHVLVISDSCYSGYLTRDRDASAAINPSDRNVYVAKMLKSKSRNLMSSGGDEPVADSGAPGHSIFAWVVLESLREMEEDTFTAAYVFQRFIQLRVGGRSNQVPQYSVILNSGHDGGDFVFVRHTALPTGMNPSLADLYHRAQAGNPRAMFMIGLDYENGEGTAKDSKLAFDWYRKAAEAGNVQAMINLAMKYQVGSPEVAMDSELALDWFRKAAEAGDTLSMVLLGGALYEGGLGVPPDYSQALSWFRKAADHGDTVAMMYLGDMYQTGRGVQQDESQAVSWYRKAAQEGSPKGMNNLGMCYQSGWGVEKDPQLAVYWLRKAAQLGDQDAKDNLKRLGESSQ